MGIDDSPQECQTELKGLETVLKETEAKYRNIFENAVEGIFRTDRQGRFIDANPSFARVHGYTSPDEIMGSIFAKDLFVEPSDHSALMERLRTSSTIQGFEAKLRTKNGNIHWVSTNVMVFRDQNGKVLSYEGTMLDITERKKTEEALSESEERYRVTIENSNDGIVILKGYMLTYANRQYIKMFEFDSSEEIVGKSIISTFHPDDLERVTDIINKRQRGEQVPSRYEFKGMTKKGNTIYVEVSAAGITHKGSTFYLVYLRDITERKRAEESLVKSHKELERLNKAQTRVVNHIAHELTTPLAVIQGNIRIMKRKFDAASISAFDKNIDSLERNTERLLDVSREAYKIFSVTQEVEAGMVLNDIDRLMERMGIISEIPEEVRRHCEALKEWTGKYIGGSPKLSRSIDPNTSVVAILEKIKQAASHRNLQFRTEGQSNLFIVMDPFILTEVLEAFVKNSVENTPDRGLIKITIEQNEKGVQIHVTDHGIGITEENQASLLDGFFHTKEIELYSTKKPFEFGAGGKGLGLLRVISYAKRYGFDISLKSTRCVYLPTDSDVCPGDIALCSYCRTVNDCLESGGTTFTVTFPVGGKNRRKR